MKLVVGGTKGGTGKTTIATNLAYMRSANGKKVLLVDADEQRSATSFSSQRRSLGIPTNWVTIQLSGISLYEELLELGKDYDDIIIDTGGRDHSSQRSALLVSDVLLIPFRPKAYDIWTIGQVKQLLVAALASNPQLKPYAVINQYDVIDAKGNDLQEAKDIINECQYLECLQCHIGIRRPFGNATSDGLSVLELESYKKPWIQKVQKEMQDLYDCIYQTRTRKAH